MVQDERHRPVPGRPRQLSQGESTEPGLQLLLLAGGDGALRVSQILSAAPSPCVIRHAESLAGAASILGAHHIDAILIQLVPVTTIPTHGFTDTVRGLTFITTLAKSHPDLPLIGFTLQDDAGVTDAALREGAQDCLALGTSDSRMLIRGLHYAVTGKRFERQIHRLTHYDRLTGLPNREFLHLQLDQILAGRRTGRTGKGGMGNDGMGDDGMVAVVMLNLDRFKLINETLGHGRGDRLLQEVARRLTACLGPKHILARHSADEFVAVLNGLADSQAAARIAQTMIDSLTNPVVLEGHEIYVTCSIGISLFPGDGDDVETLIRSADAALSRAKNQGRNHFQFYTLDMNVRTIRRLTLENDLRRAIERDEFQLHYQPQLDLKTRKITAVEALLRWQHPEFGLIPPAEFIPFAEESGLIVPVGEWVMHAACQQARLWHIGGHPDLRIAVNLSSRQFFQENVLDIVTRSLDAARLPPGNLELELTESAVMENPDEATVTLCLLNNMGVHISIDDFGTGYSSLNHLKRFPIDNLKIDRSFVNDITVNPDDAAIVKAMLAMAHSLRLKVVAEGVETMEQLRFLEAYACDAIQGYLLSRPRPAEEITASFLSPPGGPPAVIPLGLAAAGGRGKH